MLQTKNYLIQIPTNTAILSKFYPLFHNEVDFEVGSQECNYKLKLSLLDLNLTTNLFTFRLLAIYAGKPFGREL